MTEAKPSGIRPPSKISRPCCTNLSRPAIPPPSPKSSGSSMDHLWETHGRKLSEAGLRRGSDTSVVLTEDTDSFIIGDRVWVGGTKPGAIAYIGETQFAPGDWAGVVLDEPIGKNDGSVAGCRYFQCEPKRGIFSRLTRLTRQPLPETSLPSPTQRTPTTPPDNTRGCLAKSVSPSLNASTTSLSSTVSQRDLKIGDRVIISSSQGSKTGVLRYMGTTEFAPGEWCGVELDEPLGKNDGSVADKRYFECRPKYGLFAPAHKVTRSPSSKRTSCVVHKPSGAALNSTLKRTNSRESLGSISSLNSSIAGSRIGTGATRWPGIRTSTPVRSSLQEMLKEKQQEIEFLRRERDLERDRVTKAANQADQAEQSVVSIKQEYDKYREEMQKTVLNAEMVLKKLLDEKNALAMQLEEERRKCEDLLFRFEEESVNKDDIQKERSDQSVINTVNENRIKELEKQLSEERERVIQLERDSTKLFEAEEELARLRSERTIVNGHEDNNELEDLRNLNESLKETKVVLEKQVNEKTILVERYLENIKNLETKLNEKEQENVSHKRTEDEIQKDLQETKENLEEKLKYIESMKQEFETSTNALKKELTEMKKMIEDINGQHANEKTVLVAEYEKIIEDKNKQIEMKAQQLMTESQKHLESQSNVLENLKAENIKRINELSESFGQQLNVKDSKIKEISSQLNDKISEAEKLSSDLINRQDLYDKKEEELSATVQKLEELSSQLKAAEDKNVSLSSQLHSHELAAEDTKKLIKEKQQLEEDLSMLRATATDSSAHLEKLNGELMAKEKELMEVRTQIEDSKRQYLQEIEEKSRYVEKVSLDASNKTLMLEKIDKELSELRSILESKDEEIKHLTENNSELHYALTLSEQTKTNLESELRVFESNIENLKQQLARSDEKLANVSSQKEKLESDIANLISSSANSSEQLSKYNEELREKEREIDQLREKVYQAENNLSVTQGKLQSTEQELNTSVTLLQELRSEIESVKDGLSKEKTLCNEYSEKLKEYEFKEKAYLETIEKAKDMEKIQDEKSHAISDLTERLKKIEEEKISLEKECQRVKESFNKESSDLQKQLDDLKEHLSMSQEEVKSLQKAKIKLEADQSANRWSIEELTEKLTLETETRSKIESAILEKDAKIKSLENVLSELQREKETLCVNKESIHQDLTKTITSMEGTITELNNKLVLATGTIESKSNELAISQAEVEQRQTRISELINEIDLIKQAQAQVNDKVHDLENIVKEKEKELRTAEESTVLLKNNVKQLEAEIKSVRTELATKDNLLTELNEKMKNIQDSKENSLVELQDKFESEIKAKESALEISTKRNVELEKEKESLQKLVAAQTTDLNVKETTVNSLKEQLKTLEDVSMQKITAELESKKEEARVILNKIEDMRKQNKNLLITKDSLEKLVREQDSKIEMLTNTIKSKEKEAEKNMQNLIEKLNIVTTEATQLKEAQSRLEKENKQITSKLSETSNQLKSSRENIKNNIDAAGGDAKQQMDKDIEVIKLKEENENVKSQIDFLNSVIVDMQRKNETLLCKIEVLEMGVPANEADEYNRSTLERRHKAPRMFCDICDQFDLHETEDCPRQAQDFSEPEKIMKSPKNPPPERPYCENCETFGHDTRDCDDTETY